MSEIKKALITFHYAEKIKSDLIITVTLLEFLSSMQNEEIVGAEKLLTTYLNALIREVNIAKNVPNIQAFQDISAKLEQAISETKQHNYVSAIRLVSEAISMTTTCGDYAAEILKEKNLI